jgi:hypothetical protein
VIDLHTHSTVSDGSDAPSHVAELAQMNGCSAFALTDHDRMDGLDEAGKRAAEVGVELVPGCEISCEVPKGTMHVLIYFVEPGGPLETELVRLQEARDARNARMFDRLSNELGLPITPEEVEAEAGGKGIGRPHVAAVLLRKGVVSSIQEAFDVWLAKGRPAYLDKERLAPSVAVRLAVASGGVPVLAHPLSLGLSASGTAATVGELVSDGLAGVESIYGRYSVDERAAMAALAGRYGLVATGGSDHHGRYKPDLQVGIGRGDLDVPDSVLDELRERIPARSA